LEGVSESGRKLVGPRMENRLSFWIFFYADLDFASVEPESVLHDIDLKIDDDQAYHGSVDSWCNKK